MQLNIGKLKSWLPLLIFIIIIFFLVQKIATTKENNDLKKLPEISLFSLTNPQEEINLSRLQGKIFMINIFASWCTTCLAEHDILMKLKDVIDIYGISWFDIDENTKKFLQKHGDPYQMVLKDNTGITRSQLNIKGVPETLIIGKNLDIIYRQKGNLQPYIFDIINDIKGN